MYARVALGSGRTWATVIGDRNARTVWVELFDGTMIKRHIKKHRVEFRTEEGRAFLLYVKVANTCRWLVGLVKRKGKRS